MMTSDGCLRSAMVWLGVVMGVVGVLTFSLNKMFITYIFGMLAISGILLPDWDFFDRDFSRWSYPITAQERHAIRAPPQPPAPTLKRFRIYPIRAILYTIVYGFGVYNWCLLVSA